MDVKEIDQVRAQAGKRAKKSRLNHESEDFKSYAALKRVEGSEASIDQLWIDYLRDNYGDHRSKYRQDQKRIYSKPLSEKFPAKEDPAALNLNFSFIQRFLCDNGEWFSQRDRCIMTLVYQWGFTKTEVADALGVHISQVTRAAEEIETRIRRFLIHCINGKK